MDSKIDELVELMTLEEKAAIVSGHDFMNTNSIPRLNIPTLTMSDGPHGLRKQIGEADNGISKSEISTAFPTAATVACSFNKQNAYRVGAGIASECRHYGVHVLLAPGLNIKRNPLCGRNFEYYSEDPIVNGEMGASFINGVQSLNVGVALKHFAANNAENFRFVGDSVVDERCLREIYLKGFEIAVKKSKPMCVMSSYNKINGTFSSENKRLLTDILRNEWGFNGMVMTDWGGTNDRIEAIKSGCDIDMPGDTAICRKRIIDSVKDKSLSNQDLNRAVKNILNTVYKTKDNFKLPLETVKHHALCSEVACDSAVLLKNDGMLPLDKTKKYLVIGNLFESMRYQGAGSSMINPLFICSPLTAFNDAKVSFEYCKGYSENYFTKDEDLVNDAIKKAKQYDEILFFGGLTDYFESEGTDRESMDLPSNQLELLQQLVDLGKKIVVVLFGGAAMQLPFAENVNAILNMLLPGQNGGGACYKLLYGEVCPSGKLAETWVQKYSDVAFYDKYSKNEIELYKESIFVGYRNYLTKNIKVRYPFGYGLSYTSFAYSDIKLLCNNNSIAVTCNVTNIGNCDGAEVVQLYVGNTNSKTFTPLRELKGFSKVYLTNGETKSILIEIEKSDLSIYDYKKGFIIENGIYDIMLAASAEDIRLKTQLTITDGQEVSGYPQKVEQAYRGNLSEVTNEIFESLICEKIPIAKSTLPITLQSRFVDLRKTFFGRILYNAVISVSKKQMKRALRMPKGSDRDNSIKGATFLKRILDTNTLLTMSMSAANKCPYNFALGFVYIANGKVIKGIKSFTTKIKVPRLPDEIEGKRDER